MLIQVVARCSQGVSVLILLRARAMLIQVVAHRSQGLVSVIMLGRSPTFLTNDIASSIQPLSERDKLSVNDSAEIQSMLLSEPLQWAAKGDNVPRQTGHPTGPMAEIVPIYTGGLSVGWAECSVYQMERDGLNIVNGVYNGDKWAKGLLGIIEMDGPKYSGPEKEVPTRSGHRIPGSEIPAGIYQPTGSGYRLQYRVVKYQLEYTSQPDLVMNGLVALGHGIPLVASLCKTMVEYWVVKYWLEYTSQPDPVIGRLVAPDHGMLLVVSLCSEIPAGTYQPTGSGHR
ncbi:uncharacterized protein EDB93DRAFT_1104706 [Suillus bovinus]|uniref:uncharacterized protein n=1 Tax=Suillus bovinus TaxID=48563 RepID=UPI001B8834D4|nr:uncharacterized protein EDB93DRAFT_1104706 [Suillus bovinus]KAG2145456.1 hypothetical protein EDB93DRAFT_1104706 [Suillus bovinus]